MNKLIIPSLTAMLLACSPVKYTVNPPSIPVVHEERISVAPGLEIEQKYERWHKDAIESKILFKYDREAEDKVHFVTFYIDEVEGYGEMGSSWFARNGKTLTFDEATQVRQGDKLTFTGGHGLESKMRERGFIPGQEYTVLVPVVHAVGDPKEIIDDKYDLEINWSPSGEKLLYSYKSEKNDTNTNTNIRDFAKETEFSINFQATPKDCAWNESETSLYCTKATTELLSIIPEEYQKKLSLAGDSFWKIDLSNKEISEVYIPEIGEQVYSASELLVSDGESHLFFVNEFDGKLYSLSL